MNSILHRIATFVSGFWNEDLEPWLKNFLSTAVHAEVDTAAKFATTYVEQALPALVTAASTGDWNGFADAQAGVIKSTATALKSDAISVAVTSVSTAVTALINGHPAVVAATQPPAAAPAQ